MSTIPNEMHRRPRGFGGQEAAMMGDPGVGMPHQQPVRRSQSSLLTSRALSAQRNSLPRRDGVNDGGYHGFSYHREAEKSRTGESRPRRDLYSTTSVYDEDDEEMRYRTRENCAFRANRICDMIENKGGRFYQPVAKAMEYFEHSDRELPPDPVIRLFINEVRDDLRLYRYCCSYACMMVDATLIEVCYNGEEDRLERDEVFVMDIVFNNFINILGMQFLYWLEHHPDAYRLQGRLLRHTREVITAFEEKIELFHSMILSVAGRDVTIAFPWKKGALDRIIQSGHSGATTYSEYMTYAGHRRPVDVAQQSRQPERYYREPAAQYELPDWIIQRGLQAQQEQAAQRGYHHQPAYYDLGHTAPVNDNWGHRQTQPPVNQGYRGLPADDEMAEEDYTPGGAYGSVAARQQHATPVQQPSYTAPAYYQEPVDDDETILVEDPRETGLYYAVNKRTGKPIPPKAKTEAATDAPVAPAKIQPYHVGGVDDVLVSIPGTGLFTAHPQAFGILAHDLKYTGTDAPYDRKGAMSTGCLPVIEYNAGPGTYTYTNVFVGEENVMRMLSDPRELLPLYKGHNERRVVIPEFVEKVGEISTLLDAAKEEAAKGVRPLITEPKVIFANKPVKTENNQGVVNAIEQINSLVDDKAKVEPDVVAIGFDSIYAEAIYDADVSYPVLRQHLPMLFRDFELDMTLEAFVWRINQGLKKIGSDDLTHMVSSHLTNVVNRWLHENRLYSDDPASATYLNVGNILEDAKEFIDYLDEIKDSSSLRLLNALGEDLFLGENLPLFADLARINMYKADTLKVIDDDILKEAKRVALNQSVFLHKEYVHLTIRHVPPLAKQGQVMVDRSRSPELHWLMNEVPKRMKKHFKRHVNVIMSFGDSEACWAATWSGFSREKFSLRKLTLRRPLLRAIPESPCYER